MRTVYVAMLVCLLVCPASAGALERFTLAEAVEYGIQKNPTLSAADYRAAMADMDLKTARADFFPKLTTGYTRSEIISESSKGPADTDYLDQSVDTFQVGITQILYSGARILNAYSRAQAEKDMYEAHKEMTGNQLVRDIETAFFSLMKAKQDVQAAEERVKRLESGVKAARAYFEKKMVPYVQVLEAKVELASARQELIHVRNVVKKEKTKLMSVMNMPFSESVRFHGGLEYYPVDYKIDFQKAWQVALDQRPDLKALRKQQVMAKKQAKMATAEYLPRVELSAGYYDNKRDYDKPGSSFTGTYDRDQQNRYWKAAVTVQWDLFDGGRAWYRRQKFQNEIKRLEKEISASRNQIKSRLEQARLSLLDAAERIETTGEAVKAAEEYYAREKMRMEKQISTTPDVLDAQARLTRAHAEHNRALFDFQQAVAGLKFLMGADKLVEFNQS